MPHDEVKINNGPALSERVVAAIIGVMKHIGAVSSEPQYPIQLSTETIVRDGRRITTSGWDLGPDYANANSGINVVRRVIHLIFQVVGLKWTYQQIVITWVNYS